MNLKKIIILILALIVLLIAAFYFSNKNDNRINNSEGKYELAQNEIETIYQSYENDQELIVVYNNQNDTAKLYSGEADEIVFTLTVSASGAKYENNERGIVLWSKGDDVVLYLNESPIFVGGVKK